MTTKLPPLRCPASLAQRPSLQDSFAASRQGVARPRPASPGTMPSIPDTVARKASQDFFLLAGVFCFPRPWAAFSCDRTMFFCSVLVKNLSERLLRLPAPS